MANSPELSRARRGARAALIAVFAAAIAAPLMFAAPASAAEDAVGISLRPADESGAFDGRSNFRYAVDPGQSVADFAAVVNTGTETQTFTLIGTDAFNNETGDFALLPSGDQPTGLGRWVAFENGASRMEVTLGPGEGRLVPFTLTLPADASPGDQAGGIVASVVTGGQVQLDRRVAIRVYARVSGDLQPRLSISGMDVSYDGDWWNLLSGTVTVRYTVSNPGNVALAANVNGGVKTWFGAALATPPGGGIQEILPGNSASYEFSAPGIAQWGYLNPYLQLTPFVDSDDVSSYVTAAPVSRDAFLLAMPWLVVIVLALGVLAVFGVRARRRRDAARAQAWIEYTQNEARLAAQREAELSVAGARSSDA